jgi:ABC-2 type transport system ATP-binding protein
MGDQSAISSRGLSKDYGEGHGLFDLNLDIAQGEVFGLIGPNGAGKSTFIKLLMDLIKPTAGSSSIFGLDSQKDSLELKKVIGYLPGELMQFPSVTAGYILNLLLNMRGIKDREYVKSMAAKLQLDLDRKFQDLSHGNKQKVGLIQAFMHKPKLLILDEPTLGLDPIIQRELREMIAEFSAAGNTVILSSHVLSEVESVCSRIGLINEGRIIKEGTLAELRTSRVHKVTALLGGEVPNQSELVNAGAREVEIEKNQVRFEIQGSVDNAIKVLSKYQVLEFDSRELSLEEVFFTEVKG